MAYFVEETMVYSVLNSTSFSRSAKHIVLYGITANHRFISQSFATIQILFPPLLKRILYLALIS